MGFAISGGIAIVAFVMALFLTPALTALIGHAAWWPGHADTARDSGGPGDAGGSGASGVGTMTAADGAEVNRAVADVTVT